MFANYHTHTSRCNHAEGSDREYVEFAVSAGLKVLGFSDHAPYLFDGDYYSGFRMFPDQLPDYVSSVNSLKEEYADRIEIHLGVETEFYPSFFERTLALLKEQGVEYLLLGQHFIGNEVGCHYCGKPTVEEAVLDRYCGQCIDAISTGLYTYFAHPDLLNFIGESADYERHVRRLCRFAAEFGIPMELNLLGIRQGRNYPNEFFWRVAGEEGVSVVLGSDAHCPEHVTDPVSERAALELAARYSLAVLEKPDIVKI